MDLDVIKEQLGNFKTFVESMSGVLKNFPAALVNLGAVIDGKADLMAPSHGGAVDSDKKNIDTFGAMIENYSNKVGTASAQKWVDTTKYSAK